MMLDGAGGPGGRAVTVWQLGSALADAVGNGADFNAQHFRGFLAKAPREKPAISLVPRVLPGTVLDGDRVVWQPGQYEPSPSANTIAANGWSVAA